MDHNIDLLKGMQYTPTHKFIEDISDLNLLMNNSKGTLSQ